MESHCHSEGMQVCLCGFCLSEVHCCQDTLRADVKRQQTERTSHLDYTETWPLYNNNLVSAPFLINFNKNKIGLLVSLRDKLESIL